MPTKTAMVLAWQRFRHMAVPVVLCVAILVSMAYGYSNRPSAAPQPSTSAQMLAQLWRATKQAELDPYSGRVIDKSRDNITTSEGESYAMLQSVWENDRSEFNASWTWSKQNLKRPTDSLPAWLWGERSDGSYGILTDQGGENTASDADTDMALSLVFASDRWSQTQYMPTAKQMISDIWAQDVVMVDGKPVLTADNQEQNDPTSVIVNPSYFAPYAYSIFAPLDPSHDWLSLRNNMYALVDQACSMPLDNAQSANIPPDWISVNRQTGAISASATSGQTTQYSYDAMRLPYRLALDYEWNDSTEAKALLDHFGFFQGQWRSDGKLVTAYAHDGQALTGQQAPSIYGGTIGYFMISDTADAKAVYDKELLPLYNPSTKTWTKTLDYYDDNWAWFGMALYTGNLPNVAR